MQSVKLYMRQIGVPSTESGVITASAAEEEMEFKFTSAGYELHASHYLGDVKDGSGNTLGYKVLFVFAKEDTTPVRKTLKDA